MGCMVIAIQTLNVIRTSSHQASASTQSKRHNNTSDTSLKSMESLQNVLTAVIRALRRTTLRPVCFVWSCVHVLVGICVCFSACVRKQRDLLATTVNHMIVVNDRYKLINNRVMNCDLY